MRETAALICEVYDASWEAIRAFVTKIGPPTVPSLITAAVAKKETVASKRASSTIISFGKVAVSRLAPLVADDRWYAQLAGANMLGAIAMPEAVPLLQPLLRRADPRVARAAVAALGKIDDPAAARAGQT